MSVRVTAGACCVQTPHWSTSASFSHAQIKRASVDRLWRFRPRRWEAQGHGRWASRRLNHLPLAEVIIHTHHSLWSVSLRRFTAGVKHSRTQINTANIQTRDYAATEKASRSDVRLRWSRAEDEDDCFDIHQAVNWARTSSASSASQLNVSQLKHLHNKTQIKNH